METDDSAGLRLKMVQDQLVTRGIKSDRVLEAMRKVPRHMFVPDNIKFMAYDDGALQIGEGQTISQPYMVAAMTELLDLKGTEKVLEIGTGSGYQAAVLAELALEVYTVERIASLSEHARSRLEGMGYLNIHCEVGDGTLGLPGHQPFDRCIITAGAPEIPPPLMAQLAIGGILVAPVGTRFSQQLVKLTKTPAGFIEEHHTLCVFVPLIGEFGWRND